MKKLFFLFIVFFTTNLSFSQNIESKVDSIILKEFKDTNGPGGVFLISKKGKPVYKKAFGLANLELDVKLFPKDVFQIGSMTKQFTAIAILILEEQGKLSVNDPISKFIPDYPKGNSIKIHHLLTHTSGIKDFTKMKTISEIAQKEIAPKEMVDFFKNEPVDFAPGEKFEYNNSGYVALGYIIELASKEKYEDFIKKNIFDKIGMNDSYYASDRKIIANRAYGYHKKSNGYVNKTVINFSVPFSSGSLMSTLDDMLKWQNALNQNLLLQPANLEKAFTKYSLNNGEKIEYGYGWHLKNINGVPTREHGGSIFGFKSMAVYIPDEDTYVLGFSNCDCNSPTQVTRDIAKLVIENKNQK
ncbi:serine hydrolase domain-containing protein [Flavobacterium aestivum]|uniref:serine hydrolase domain-containing protein n=1 Tax=Flavobacterium aestivum TaxID=3003257 RepID=UPI002483123F|nr:serine hydrolase domain-containing protein [Flavobacterium aestivum]